MNHSPNRMSKDRVRFTIPGTNLIPGKPENDATLDAATEAFNVARQDLINTVGATYGRTIICRPSQFARFLILRDQKGGRNGFKELQATLFSPAPTPRHIDVSTRQNHVEAPHMAFEDL